MSGVIFLPFIARFADRSAAFRWWSPTICLAIGSVHAVGLALAWTDLSAMTRPALRGRDIEAALLREAKRLAVERQRTLLVLDTATDGGASGLYESRGFTLTGEIPDFAFTPPGVLTATRIDSKRIRTRPSQQGADP